MAQSLADPVFISMLEDNEGSILIIEDAEETIMSRDSGGNNLAVSTLLNLTDGLLADVLNLKIICTFNTDIQNLDIALLRPGRLRAKYEFKELSPEKAQVILDKQGLDKKVSGPMTLAQLYNQEDTEPIFLSTRNAIGF
jgi:ATP-dependent 26S proteasome regulatory subunit